ncbi:putative L-gulonolactone oxidase [Leptomonas seymouri]|uniref:Putative L-gulonolactone oxidase n=1 Tax=Leptomonas seymouri TaxID=5684 RepID=A0A0N1IA41_LEPSE|nr:putative L-gulonolactone oxidase [Leptomonas seymouri]|eukprot:KPI89085.1 putative L-gulonolactone oxidase [Leptomonas seymouri]
MSHQWTNLAQIGFCTPAHHHYPASTMEVQQAIAFVRACKGKCRVAGAGKSPNSSTFTSEHLIHMNRMNRILSIDADTCTLTCEAGALMEDVMNVLDKEGLMLRCVPSYVRTTVGGCIATATHSSGITCHSLSDYVRELKVVDGRGEVKTLGPAAGKELRLAACHLGALGVVTEIKLEVQPRVQWRLENNPLSMADANDAALVARKVRENEYYRWWWVPHTDGCYESYGNAHCEAAGSLAAPKVNKKELEMKADPKARVTPKRPLPDGEPPKNGGLGAQYPDETKPGSVAVEASAAAAPVDRSNAQSNCHNGFAVGAAPVMSALTNWISNELIRHQLVEWSLWVACRFPSLQPHINRAYQRMFYTTPAVLRGSALHCFTFDCLFRQWANEWAIDASRAVEAFQKIRSMIDREQMLLHFPVEFRFSAADDSDMSPAFGRKTCWIGVVMYRPRGQEARDTRRAYDGFNKLMEEMQGRPHWAKYYNWGHREVSAAYGNGWDRFLELRRKMDPDDMFLNAWLSNLMSPDRVNSTDFKGK